jgi:hypothetical protein
MRPIADDRNNSLLTNSFHTGKRAEAVMRLMQSAPMSGYDVCAYRRDLMAHPPLHHANQISELLLHRWLSTLQQPLKPLRSTVKTGCPPA